MVQYIISLYENLTVPARIPARIPTVRRVLSREEQSRKDAAYSIYNGIESQRMPCLWLLQTSAKLQWYIEQEPLISCSSDKICIVRFNWRISPKVITQD